LPGMMIQKSSLPENLRSVSMVLTSGTRYVRSQTRMPSVTSAACSLMWRRRRRRLRLRKLGPGAGPFG
jgi:hypothetical protein